MKRILFVCHGNICRSPMAEMVMAHLVELAGKSAEYQIASAATHDEELGNPIYPPARRKLMEKQIPLRNHLARPLTAADGEKWDWILAMDHENLRYIRSIIGTAASAKVALLLNFAGGDKREVADPWYTGDFDATYQDIELGCRSWFQQLEN